MRMLFIILSIVIGLQAHAMSQEVIASIEKEFDVELDYDFSDDEIESQSQDYENIVGFSEAAHKAIKSFREDMSENSLFFDLNEEEGETQAIIMLQKCMHKRSCTFGHVPKNSLLLPCKREPIAKNWVFYFNSDNLDRTYWAIVARDGEKATYNYSDFED